MTLQDKKNLISVVVSDHATPRERELAEWLVREMERAAAEPTDEQPVEDEGKPKTPLPDEEEEVPPCEAAFEDEYPLDSEWREEREANETRMRGFLTGLVTAWFVIGFGVLLVLAGRKVLGWLAGLLAIPFDMLIGLCLLFLLATLLRRKMKRLAAKLVHWLDPDF